MCYNSTLAYQEHIRRTNMIEGIAVARAILLEAAEQADIDGAFPVNLDNYPSGTPVATPNLANVDYLTYTRLTTINPSTGGAVDVNFSDLGIPGYVAADGASSNTGVQSTITLAYRNHDGDGEYVLYCGGDVASTHWITAEYLPSGCEDAGLLTTLTTP